MPIKILNCKRCKLIPYQHPRKGESGTGKKDEKNERAKTAGAGKFAPMAPPLKLVK